MHADLVFFFFFKVAHLLPSLILPLVTGSLHLSHTASLITISVSSFAFYRIIIWIDVVFAQLNCILRFVPILFLVHFWLDDRDCEPEINFCSGNENSLSFYAREGSQNECDCDNV